MHYRLTRLILLLPLLLLLPRSLQAQTLQFTQTGVTSAAQAQGFTFRLYTTPAGATTANPAVVIASVTCTGTTTATCSAPVPTAASAALSTGARNTLTSQDTVNGTGESAQSIPFLLPADVPTGVRIVKP